MKVPIASHAAAAVRAAAAARAADAPTGSPRGGGASLLLLPTHRARSPLHMHVIETHTRVSLYTYIRQAA